MTRHISTPATLDERGSSAGAIGRTLQDWWRRRRARRTVALLYLLSDHQLRDIGLRRSELGDLLNR
jgi:uncharacterized protein YjiS (DUF1127 family)